MDHYCEYLNVIQGPLNLWFSSPGPELGMPCPAYSLLSLLQVISRPFLSLCGSVRAGKALHMQGRRTQGPGMGIIPLDKRTMKYCNCLQM